MKDLSGYKTIVGYGIGQYYEYMKPQLPAGLHMDFLCDKKWEEIGAEYDGIKVISPESLIGLKNVFIIVFSGNPRNYNSIAAMLNEMQLPFAHAEEVWETAVTITGKQLKKLPGFLYEDMRGNRIEYANDIEDSVTIHFTGSQNRIIIRSGVSIGRLEICCGNNAQIYIGAGTEIEDLKIHGTDGEIWIGEDCLVSYQVIFRNHDVHHIFDKNTGRRINYPGNIKVGNHVWLGYGATLLGNASIGDNSIVGTMSVTSSTFPKEVIIAGSPAKIIREHVLWSKDNTEFYNHKLFEECLAKEALKYTDDID